MSCNRFLARILAIVLSVAATNIIAAVVQSTAFTYQGQLNAGGTLPAGQTYQFTFTLYDAPTLGNVIGTPIKQAILVGNGGLFTTDLNFGQIFNGTQYWLDIQVGTTTLNEQGLAARQPINTVPIAQYALSTPQTFAEFYHSYSSAVSTTLAVGATVPFPNSGPSSGNGIVSLIEPGMLPPFDLTQQFLVSASGTYEVSFEVSTSDAGGNSLELVVNQFQPLPYTLVSMETKTQVGKFLVNLQAGDRISLVNASNFFTLHLAADQDGATDANIVIKLLR